MSGQHLTQDDVDKFSAKFGVADTDRVGTSGTQVWGIEDEFVKQMVKFGHPSTLQSCLPVELRDAVEKYQCMDLQQRVSYRADKLGFWLRRLQALRAEECKLKATVDPEVAATLKGKNILFFWKEMLVATNYPD